MTSKNERRSIQDYWKFTRELRAQLNLIEVLQRQFFGLDDLCEYVIRNDVTVIDNNTGKRVSLVDESLAGRQVEVYERLRIEVGNLYDMLSIGRRCFDLERE